MTRPNGTPPRPIAGFPSVSALARHLRTTRQDAKRILRQRKQAEADRKATQRQIAAWEARA